MVNGKFFDENRVDAAIPQGTEEVRVIQNPGGSWRHPVHIHFEEHRMQTRKRCSGHAEQAGERCHRLFAA